MENKITPKTTKAELLEIIKQQEEIIKQKESLVDDPLKEQKRINDERVLKSAAENIDSGLFSEELESKYSDLIAATGLQEKRLKELYEIEAKAQTLTAIINAFKVKNEELEKSFADKRAALEKDYENKKEEVAACETKLILDYKKKKEELEDDFKQVRDNSNKQHIRAEEEYEYDLSRKKQEDADKWNDEKTAREKLMAEKETDLKARMVEFAEKEAYLKDLEEQVAAFPDKLKEAETAGKEKGKADADKSHVFEVRAIKNEYNYQVRTLQDKLDTQDQLISNLTERNKALEDKLDASYAQMRELAADTVKSTGGVKILSSDVNKTAVGK
ncbi:Uncharacterised protein [uncultured Clostridium sp.]|nr:Uncharacterised protein [uncultured Clostridium sp.]